MNQPRYIALQYETTEAAACGCQHKDLIVIGYCMPDMQPGDLSA